MSLLLTELHNPSYGERSRFALVTASCTFVCVRAPTTEAVSLSQTVNANPSLGSGFSNEARADGEKSGCKNSIIEQKRITNTVSGQRAVDVRNRACGLRSQAENGKDAACLFETWVLRCLVPSVGSVWLPGFTDAP